MDAIMEIAAERGLAVVEDCAQAFGSRSGGRVTGSIGTTGSFSFYPTKVLGAYGDGGMITTSSPQIDEQVRRLRHRTETSVAGVLFRPHRPPTRSGRVVAFFMLEDETGLFDLAAFEEVYRLQGDLLFGDRPPVLGVRGRVERRGRGIVVQAEELFEPLPHLRVQ
jgi:DNA polymerase III alpha subunit